MCEFCVFNELCVNLSFILNHMQEENWSTLRNLPSLSWLWITWAQVRLILINSWSRRCISIWFSNLLPQVLLQVYTPVFLLHLKRNFSNIFLFVQKALPECSACTLIKKLPVNANCERTRSRALIRFLILNYKSTKPSTNHHTKLMQEIDKCKIVYNWIKIDSIPKAMKHPKYVCLNSIIKT